MGIEVSLRWHGQTTEGLEAQDEPFLADVGHLGYLRESYTGGPYATNIIDGQSGRRID